MMPVWMTPTAIRIDHCSAPEGAGAARAIGASISVPVITWIRAIRCGGVPLSSFVSSAAIA
ncbi:hypothetical protein D3C71_2237920 [compost metagenome]